MITRVYQYGLLPPDSNADGVREQMRLAHRYYNDLIAIERGRRAAERELLGNHRGLQWLTWAAEFWQEEARTTGIAIKANRSASRSRSETAAMRDAYARAKRELTQARKTLAFGRALVRASSDMTLLYERQNELKKSARAHCGVYWGSYLLVEAAVDNAASEVPLYDGVSANDPAFRRWTGSGHVSAQIQGGMTTKEILDGEDTRVRIIDVTRGTPRRGRRFCKLMLRVGSDGRDPVWAEWPMLMDRPLPEDARIKVVTVSCKRDGYRDRWTTEITFKRPAPQARHGGTVGIDIGWRVMGNELRVAYWRGDDGAEGEVRLDTTMLSQLTKASSLRSIRDRAQNEMRDKLTTLLAGKELPEWLRRLTVRRAEVLPSNAQTVAHLAQWRSASRFVSLARAWAKARFDGDESAFALLEAWSKQDHHLWLWETEQRHQAIERRKHFYRNFAAQLATRYANVALEDFNLRRIAKRQPVDGEAENDAARSNRQLAATSRLRDAVKHAFVSRGGRIIEVPAPGTTRLCAECGGEVIGDAAATVVLACENGHVEDQDRNAAANILHRASVEGDAEAPAGARSAPNDGNDSSKTAAPLGKWNRKKQDKRARDAARNATSNTTE